MKEVIVIYSHVVGLAVIRALGQQGVPVNVLYYKDCEMGHYSKYIKRKIKVPDPGLEEDKFVASLLDLSKKFKNSLIIPSDDYTAITISKHKATLKNFYIVGVEDWEICQQFFNKQNTYDIADSLGIPCPASWVPESLRGLKSIIKNKNISFPCLLKPTEGHRFFDIFKEKMFKIENENDLLNNYIKTRELGMDVMIQELIPGADDQGVNYNSYFVNGQPIAEFTAKKVRIEPPFFGSPRVIKSKVIPEIIEPGRLLLQKLKYEGFSCMEFKQDSRDGIYKLMEVNCRNNLSGSLAVRCGINFPWIMYKHLVYGEIKSSSAFLSDIYWIDISHDLMRFFVSRKKEGYSLRQYIKPYLAKKTFAIFSISDPLPFFMRWVYLVKLPLKIIYTTIKESLKLGTRKRNGLARCSVVK